MPGTKTAPFFFVIALFSTIASAQDPSLLRNAPAPVSSDGADTARKALAPTDYSKEPFVMESISTKVVFENDGTYSSESTIRVRVQSQAGLQQFGLLGFPYASAISTMDVVYVRVTKPDRRIIETPAENSLDMPTDITREAPFYSDQKEKQVAVRGLEIGDTVEYQYRSQTKTALDPGQFWFAYNFFEAGIVLNESLQISVPRDRYVQLVSPKSKPTIGDQGAYKTYEWKNANLERKPEGADPKPRDPNEPDHASVELTSLKNWNELGQWFRGLAAPRAAVTPEIQQKANEITRDARTESEKIQAIYHYVSTKFRYIGISLGIGRIQPHSAADVLTNDYGDCKDKHTLFAALLAAVGVKSYPALISTTGKIDPNFPSLFLFDHIITALPRDKGYLFLDTTPEVAPFGFLIAGLRDKQALVLPDDGPPQLVKTPFDPPFKSFMTFQADGTLNDSGTFDGKMEITLRGDPELSYRYAFRRAGQPQWKDVMQQISSNLSFGGTVSDVTVSPTDVTDGPFHIEYNYTRKEYGDWENRRIIFPCPPVFLPEAPKEADAAKHASPIQLGTPFETLYRGTMKLPPNSHPHLLPPLDLHESFADYRSMSSVSGGVIHYERHIITKSREVTPEQFDAYRKFIKAIVDDVTTFITLRSENFSSADSSSNPEAQAFYQQGAEAWRRHDMEEAARLYQKALDKDPKFAGPMYWLGAAHVATGQADRGIEEMKKSITLDPTQVQNYQYLSSLFVDRHRDAEALELWRQLLKTNPDASQASEQIVQILFRLERYSEAVPELETATGRNPGMLKLQLQLGEAYAYAGNPQKASEAFERALALDSSAATLNSVAYSLANNNIKLDDALKYSQKAIAELEEKSSEISLQKLLAEDVRTASSLSINWDTLGWVHLRMGHFDLAEKYLNAAWLLTQDSVIADHLGQTYEKLGRKHDAAIAYSRALAASSPPKETRGRLEALRKGVKPQPGEDVSQLDLQEFRSYKLGRLAAKHVSAEFYVLINSGSKPVDVEFISGSDELRTAIKPIAELKFRVLFPDAADTQILRQGILDCEPELPGCVFVLIPTSSTQFTKLPVD